MRLIVVRVVQVVLPTILVGTFNYWLAWTHAPRGEVIYGAPLTMEGEGRQFGFIEIVNYGSKPLGTVRLAIPVGTRGCP
jgi:hypothetical protein